MLTFISIAFKVLLAKKTVVEKMLGGTLCEDTKILPGELDPSWWGIQGIYFEMGK